MNISITGTRRGMTQEQRKFMTDILDNTTRLVHGGADGADHECHEIFAHPEFTVVYPSNHTQWKRYISESLRCLHPPIAPLERNRLIVRAAPILYAMPGTMQEQLRSGTWATIRFARNTNRPHVIVWPDGSATSTFAVEIQY